MLVVSLGGDKSNSVHNDDSGAISAAKGSFYRLCTCGSSCKAQVVQSQAYIQGLKCANASARIIRFDMPSVHLEIALDMFSLFVMPFPLEFLELIHNCPFWLTLRPRLSFIHRLVRLSFADVHARYPALSVSRDFVERLSEHSSDV